MITMNNAPSAPAMSKLLQQYSGHVFESSSYTTPEFALFARKFKSALQKSLASDFELVGFNRGHFYLSGFIRDNVSGQFCYFSTSDVRYFSDWVRNILVRTAKSAKDYTGGSNQYTTLEALPVVAMAIAERGL